MSIVGDALSQAIEAKNNDVNSYVWKGPKKDVNGKKIQEEIRLVDMTNEQLQSCFDHCVSMLYNKNADNPGRYVLLNIIKEQRMKCNAELYIRWLRNSYLPSERSKISLINYVEAIKIFLRNNQEALIYNHDITENNGKTIKQQLDEISIGEMTPGIPVEFESLPNDIVIDACLDTLGVFNKKHITLNFITKLPMWFTPQEMKDLTEHDENGKVRNRLEVIKERLNIKNNTRLIIDDENPKLNYTEFRAAIQLKNKKYSDLTTDQLVLLRGKLLFILEEEVEEHIKQWETRITQINEVCNLKGYTLQIND